MKQSKIWAQKVFAVFGLTYKYLTRRAWIWYTYGTAEGIRYAYHRTPWCP